MRGKIISCFAAGTFSVCLLYSSISQVLRGQSPAAQAAEAWQIAPAAIVANADTEEIQEEKTEEQQPFPQENNIYGQDSSNEDTFPDVQPSREGRRGKGGGRHGRRNKDSAPDNNENTDSYFPNGNTQFEEEEELEEDSALKDSYEDRRAAGRAIRRCARPAAAGRAIRRCDRLSAAGRAIRRCARPAAAGRAFRRCSHPAAVLIHAALRWLPS